MLSEIYLIALIPYIPFWLWLYRSGDQEDRKEMILMSIFFAVTTPMAAAIWWNHDWWAPPGIFGSSVWFEDILLGFLFGGIIPVAYEGMFRKKEEHAARPHWYLFIGLFIAVFAINAVCYSIFELSSFWSISIAIAAVSPIMLALRRDLLHGAIMGALCSLLVSIPVYVIISALSPDWATVTYKYENLSGITLAHFPIEEFIFWAMFGFCVGPAYEFARGRGFKRV